MLDSSGFSTKQTLILHLLHPTVAERLEEGRGGGGEGREGGGAVSGTHAYILYCKPLDTIYLFFIPGILFTS